MAREERKRIEGELQRLVESIAEGNGSSAIMAAINQREARLRTITDKLFEPGRGSLEEKLDELQTFALGRLTKFRSLLVSSAAIHEARALLAEQVGKLTLERVTDGDNSTYRANGKFDFFGKEAFTRVGGAGGPARVLQPQFLSAS